MRAGFLTMAILATGLAACSNSAQDGDVRLHKLSRDGRQPEEFSIVPSKPLEIPQDLASLPEPTPGGSNRTDLTPLDDAVVALGGRVSRADGAAPAQDQALIAAAGRFGVSGDIRPTLAAEDLAFRESKSRFSWQLIKSDRYYDAYEDQSLDPYDWLTRFRAMGVQTPLAPPAE